MSIAASDPFLAESHASLAFELARLLPAEGTGAPGLEGLRLEILALLCSDTGDYGTALSCGSQALEIYRDLRDWVASRCRRRSSRYVQGNGGWWKRWRRKAWPRRGEVRQPSASEATGT